MRFLFPPPLFLQWRLKEPAKSPKTWICFPLITPTHANHLETDGTTTEPRGDDGHAGGVTLERKRKGEAKDHPLGLQPSKNTKNMKNGSWEPGGPLTAPMGTDFTFVCFVYLVV